MTAAIPSPSPTQAPSTLSTTNPAELLRAARALAERIAREVVTPDVDQALALVEQAELDPDAKDMRLSKTQDEVDSSELAASAASRFSADRPGMRVVAGNVHTKTWRPLAEQLVRAKVDTLQAVATNAALSDLGRAQETEKEQKRLAVAFEPALAESERRVDALLADRESAIRGQLAASSTAPPTDPEADLALMAGVIASIPDGALVPLMRNCFAAGDRHAAGLLLASSYRLARGETALDLVRLLDDADEVLKAREREALFSDRKRLALVVELRGIANMRDVIAFERREARASFVRGDSPLWPGGAGLPSGS